MKLSFLFENRYHLGFLIVSVILLTLLPILSFDSSFTDDERIEMNYGKRVLNYYLGKDKEAIVSPFDEHGVWLLKKEGVESKRIMNLYGSFYDFVAIALYEFISPVSMDEYAFKHVLTAVLGAVFLIFTGLLAFKITDDWRVAFFTLIIASLTPRIIGHSFVNPKDIPFGAFFLFSLYGIAAFLKDLPRIKIRRLFLLALSISITIAIRSGAIILIGYLLLFTVLVLLSQYISREISFSQALKAGTIAVLVAFVGYIGCALFWPWAMQNPLVNPYKALQVLKDYNQFNSLELFEGRWINNTEIPWYFVPRWFYITFPVSLTVGFFLFFALASKIVTGDKMKILLWMLLIFSVFFPVASIIINRSNIYDDGRHLLFIVPGIAAMAGSAWSYLLKSIRGRMIKLTVGAFFAWTLYEPLSFMVRNHPLEAMYFSPFIGGAKGAFKNYEMDYWGFSLRSALQWIEQNDSTIDENNKARVRLWYGEQLKIKYFTQKSTKLQHVMALENSEDWDYSLQLPVEAKFNHDLLCHWPPEGTVYQVMVDSVPLCAVIKNWRATKKPEIKPVTAANTSLTFLRSGLAYYNAKNFNAAYVEFKKALLLDSSNVLVINNIVAALNELGMYDDAIWYAKQGLKIDATFQLLKNNLDASLKANKGIIRNERYLAAKSYNYFMQKEFAKCIEASEMLLKMNPSNTIAYNNICSAYNEIGEYRKAIAACSKGLQLAPADQLLRNNKIEAEKRLRPKLNP